MVGTLIAIISAFQFGEVSELASPEPNPLMEHTLQVLIEWSKERYAVQFSIYADNIASRSFETK